MHDGHLSLGTTCAELEDLPASRMKTVFLESADCFVNMEIVSRTQKRCRMGIGNEATSRKVNGFDQQYVSFLEMCQQPCCDSETEENEFDPNYLSFLENIREHGNSYIFDVPSDHGVRFSLKYEVDDKLSDDLKRKIPKSHRRISDVGLESGVEKLGSLEEDTLIEKRRSSHLDGELKSCVKTMGSPKIVENLMISPQKIPVSKHNRDVGFLTSQDHRSNSKPVDWSYNVFISGAKVSEQSVSYEYGDHNQIYYEEGNQHKSNNIQNKPSKTVHTTKSQVSRSPTPTPTPSELSATAEEPTAKHHGDDSDNLLKRDLRTEISRPTILSLKAPTSSHIHLQRMPTPKYVRDGSTAQSPISRSTTPALPAQISSPSQIPRMPTAKDCQNGSNKPSTKVSTTKIPSSRPRAPTPRAPTLNPFPIPRTPTAHDCHNISDKPLKRASKTQIPIPKAPTSSSIPIPRTSVTLNHNLHNSKVNSNSESTPGDTLKQQREDNIKNRALFRKRLEIKCRQPFEQKEYEDLLGKITVRKPINIHRETRGREYAKEVGMGKSYLDIHQDLYKEIKKVKSDHKKVLNLLRGFFLYLQYVPYGISPPWNIDHLKTIMLGST